MQSVVLYGRDDCEYSAAARELLEQHGIRFDEIDVASDPKKMSEMLRRSGGRHTTPQIFIDGRHIGGCDELRRLAAQGGLDDAAGAPA